MKFSRETPAEHPMSLTFPDAYNVVWSAANMAVADSAAGITVKEIMSEEFGNIFAKLDSTAADAVAIAGILSEDETPKVTLVSLLSDYANERRQLHHSQGFRGDSEFNPFLVHDDRLIAIESLSLYITASANSLHDTATS
jgi:hypothetical protein